MASSPEVIRARTSARMQRMAAARRVVAEENDEVCELCGEPIDYGAEARSSRSWSLEHRVSMKVNMTLAFSPENHGSSHYGCNSRRGQAESLDRRVGSSLEPQSMDW